MTQHDLVSSRLNYDAMQLDERDVAADPYMQFSQWLEAASADPRIDEANAMTVASVDTTGQPSARIVLLRGVDENGFVFFTNYQSRKGRELDATPKAALLFYWDALEREVRIEGAVERLAPAESDTYFAKRPVGHRLSAWASPQSEVVGSRSELEAAMQRRSDEFGDSVPRPPYWGGYRVRPLMFEFWQGRRNRIHDRIRYQRTADRWIIERLAP